MVNDVIVNKIQTIDRCLKRINEVYENNPENLKDYTKQDSIILKSSEGKRSLYWLNSKM